MGQRTDGYKVDACLSVCAQCLEGDAARRFDFGSAINELDCFACGFRSEIVEHDAVHSGFERFEDFFGVAHFLLNLQVATVGLAISLGGRDSLRDAAGKVDVIVLNQDHVVEAYSMVHAAAYSDSLFLHQAHARSGLACVENFCFQPFEPRLIAIGHCGYAAHALHDVEHGAFGLEQRPDGAFDGEGNVAGLYAGAVFNEDFHLQLGVEALENTSRNIHSGQDALLFDNQFLFATGLGRNGGEGSVVTVTHVFGECQVYQSVDEFVVCELVGLKFHNFRYFCTKIRYYSDNTSTKPMKILLLVVGKTTASYLNEGIKLYTERINRYVPFEIGILPDVKTTRATDPNRQKQAEGERILGELRPGDRLLLLDERGRQPTSRGFAELIERQMIAGDKRLIFVVGGPYGFSDEVYARADGKVSFSAMTFSHEMIRLFFVEQLYRAFTIIRGEPYHHD